MLKSPGISTIFRIYRLTYILIPLGSFWSIFEARLFCLYQGQPPFLNNVLYQEKYQEQTLSYSWYKRHQLGRASSDSELDSPSFKNSFGPWIAIWRLIVLYWVVWNTIPGLFSVWGYICKRYACSRNFNLFYIPTHFKTMFAQWKLLKRGQLFEMDRVYLFCASLSVTNVVRPAFLSLVRTARYFQQSPSGNFEKIKAYNL